MCPYCSSACILFGKSVTGSQRYRCKSCKKTHTGLYIYRGCQPGTDQRVSELLKEGCGNRSISRILKMSVGTVSQCIMRISRKIVRPLITLGKEYELDELCTYVRKKANLQWVVYAIRKDTREVVGFSVGCRTNKTLQQVTDTLILSRATKVYTDKLQQYKTLLPKDIHVTKQYGTNYIERKNLSLRTHLRRLFRRTICFSKSVAMLSACLKIYFWG